MDHLFDCSVSVAQHDTLGVVIVYWCPWSIGMHMRQVLVRAVNGGMSCYVDRDGLLVNPATCLAEPAAAWELCTMEQHETMATLAGIVMESFQMLTLARITDPVDMPKCSWTDVG